MAFCSGCGSEVGAGVAFCPKCGKSVSEAAAGGGAAAGTAGIEENVAGLLCYLGWFVTGLIFFLIDKRPAVRFHAMQSMILFGCFFVLQGVLWRIWFGGIIGTLVSLFGSLVGLLAAVCWIVCMVKAYQGQRFKLPVIGDLAENFSK